MPTRTERTEGPPMEMEEGLITTWAERDDSWTHHGGSEVRSGAERPGRSAHLTRKAQPGVPPAAGSSNGKWEP